MNYATLCSGIEAPTIAWYDLGWKPVFFSEIKKLPCALLEHYYPEIPNLGDMEKIDGRKYRGRVDLLCAGTPCQSFSIAGLREGMDDPRGNLALEYARIISEVRSRWFIWENVPGVLSSNKGWDFGAFIGKMVEYGYGCAWRMYDAQYFGLAQKRKRIFVVGHLGDWRPAFAVLSERESLRRDFAPSESEADGITRNVTPSLRARSNASLRLDSDEYIPCYWDRGQISQTLDAVLKKQQMLPEKNRFPAVLEPCFSDGSKISGTIDAGEGKKWGSNQWIRNNHAVLEPKAVHNHPQDSRVKLSNKAETLSGRMGTGGNNTPMTIQPIGFNNRQDPVNSEGLSPAIGAKDRGVGVACEYAVRRLTPIECERLQGFPDNYTNIPYGRPKYDDQICPDSHRYEAIGNSMPVPVMRWIAKRIILFESIKLGDESTAQQGGEA